MEAQELKRGLRRAKTRKLKAKVQSLKDELNTAKHRIQDLEQENLNLIENSENMKRELNGLKSTLHASKEPNSKTMGWTINPSFPSSASLASHEMRLHPLPNILGITAVDSSPTSSSFAPLNDPIHSLPKFVVPAQRVSPLSALDPQPSKKKRRLPKTKATGGPKSTTSAELAQPSVKSKEVFELIPKSLEFDLDASKEIIESMDHCERSVEALELIDLMSREQVLEDDTLYLLAELFFDQDPTILQFISSQQLPKVNSSLLTGSKSTPTRTRKSWSQPNSTALQSMTSSIAPTGPDGTALTPWISFAAPVPPSPLALFKTPFEAFQEQTYVLRFVNTSSSEICVNVLTFPSRGAFFGFSMSRSRLQPQQDCRLTLTLTGTAIETSNSLLIVSITKEAQKAAPKAFSLPSGSSTPTRSPSFLLDSPRAQYYLLGSQVEMTKPKTETPYWRFNLTELKETLPIIYKTPIAIIAPATLQAASLTSRKFNSMNGLQEFANFSRFLEISSLLPLHPNIIQVVGASDKRPYRILSPSWMCSLSASLMNTCSQQSDDAPGSNFQPLRIFQGGEARSWLVSHHGPPETPILSSLSSRIAIAQDVVTALSVLHSRKILHRDLSSCAIGLLSEREALLVELNSCLEIEGKNVPFSPAVPRWQAPETSSSGIHTIESDVYALGVLLFDLVVGAPLSTTFAANGLATFDELLEEWQVAISSKSSLSTLNETTESAEPLLTMETAVQHFTSLIRCCCSLLPSNRPSLKTISKHLAIILSEVELPE